MKDSAEHEEWLAGWSPPFCVTCEAELTAVECVHPNNNGDYDEICVACAAREGTPMPATETDLDSAPPPSTTPCAVELHVNLTPEEIKALQKACEYVRVHMAHKHSWAVRDTAMEAISKVLDAARTASS